MVEAASVSNLLISIFSWITLYFLLCLLQPKRSYEWHCRSVTVIHAVLVVCLSGYCVFIEGPWVFTDPGGTNSKLQNLTVAICLGYFLFDFTWCCYFRTEGGVMMVHHTLSVVGLSCTLWFSTYGIEMAAVLCGTELTNPLLQMRWFLRETGNYKSLAGDVVDIVFLVLFGFVRLVIGSCLLYSYFTNPNTDYLGRFAGLSIYSISWLFWYSIVRFAIKKYSKKGQKLKQNREKCQSNDADSSTNEIHSANGKVAASNRINGLMHNGIHNRSRGINGNASSTANDTMPLGNLSNPNNSAVKKDS